MNNNNLHTCALCRGTAFLYLFRHHYGWKMQKCASCGLVQVMPRPSPAEIATLYHDDMEHFTPYIEQLAVHREYFRRKIKEIKQRITPFQISSASRRTKSKPMAKLKTQRSKLKLLDVGCAMGVLMKEAERAGFASEGVDISKDAVSYCRNHGMKAYAGTLPSFTKISLKRGRLARLENRYDVITAFEVIEHEQDPLGMAKSAYRLLKKGGLLVLGTPDHGGLWRRVMGKHWFGYKHPEHIVLFDPDTITKLLKNVGFRDIEVNRDETRKFPLSFVFTRGADYVPWLTWLLVPTGNLVKRLHLMNPVNPWDDMIIYARK